MTVSTIIDNAAASVVSAYPAQARPVIDQIKSDVEAHLDEVKERLTQYATGRGLSSHDVESLFVEVGLTEPTPEPEPEVAATATISDAGLGERLSSIESTLDRLVRFAQRHGL